MKFLQRNRDSVKLFPGFESINRYRFSYLIDDIKAGATVALLALPQAMTCALVADLPPTVGIFSVIFGCIFAAAFGSSSHLITGSTSVIAILMQSTVAEILYDHYRNVDPSIRDIIALQITNQLTLMIGTLQILAGIFKLGKLTHFVSRSVIVGYIVGTAIAVTVNQCFYFLGMPKLEASCPLYEQIYILFTHINVLHLPTLFVGIMSLLMLIFIPKIKKELPESLIAIITMSLLVSVFKLSPEKVSLISETTGCSIAKVPLIRDAGIIEEILPSWKTTYFNIHILNKLLPTAFAVALMGILEVASVVKTISTNSGQQININQDIFGLGIGNVFSSFFGAMPSSGSISRTYINFFSGGRTRLASVFCGFSVIFILWSLGKVVILIPLTSLAALMFVTSLKMINYEQLKCCFKATGGDAIVLSITMISCCIFNFDVAFYIGVVISIVFYLQKSASPYLVECSFSNEEGLQAIHNRTYSDKEELFVRIVSVEGEFFFGSVDVFQNTIKEIVNQGVVKVIILNLQNARHMDATACLVLKQLYEYVKSVGCLLLPTSISRPVWKVLKRSGLIDQIGGENIFILNQQYPNVSIRKALERAKEIINKK